MDRTSRPSVLIIEDEEPVAQVYEHWLSGDYDVRVAMDGETALSELDDSVDVVLLDRRMPGPSGGEVLSTIRERAYDVRVSMVTAVSPDFDIIAMGFDDYVEKPVTREELVGTIERLLRVADYDAELQEFFSLVAKKAALIAEKPGPALDESAEYQALLDAIEEVRSSLDDRLADLHHDDYDAMFRGLAMPGEESPVPS